MPHKITIRIRSPRANAEQSTLKLEVFTPEADIDPAENRIKAFLAQKNLIPSPKVTTNNDAIEINCEHCAIGDILSLIEQIGDAARRAHAIP